MFLFTINCIFIALAAFVITKYLKFPMRKYINQAKRKRISRIASLIAFVILAFSIYLFYQLYVLNDYTIKAEKFIENLKAEGVNIIGDSKESINFQEREIKLYVFGSDYSGRDKDRWEEQIKELGLKNTKLTILKSQDDSGIREDIDKIKELYINSHQMLSSRDETIKEKDLRINELEKDLRRYYANEVHFDRIIKEIQINYADLEEIGYSREYVSNFEKMDTLNVISVKWKNEVSNRQKKQQEEKLKEWLKARLDLKNLEIREK